MNFFLRYTLLLIFLLVSSVSTFAEDTNAVIKDSVPKFIYSVGGEGAMNHLFNITMREEKLVKRGWGGNYSLFMTSQANPLDSAISVYDRVFGFPTLEAGVQLLDYSHTRLHTGNVPYNSSLGYVWVAYIGFRRDIYRNRKWSFGYLLENGLTYSSRPYNADDNVDNDMIGQHLSLYFGVGCYAGYRVTPQVELSVGAEYKHVSNGATARPNKGSNSYGLAVRARCDLNRPELDKGQSHAERRALLRAFRREPFESYFYLDVNATVGFRTMYEEWLLHREYLEEGAPRYHDGDLGLHTVWSAALVPMFRYNQVHASGL